MIYIVYLSPSRVPAAAPRRCDDGFIFLLLQCCSSRLTRLLNSIRKNNLNYLNNKLEKFLNNTCIFNVHYKFSFIYCTDILT